MGAPGASYNHQSGIDERLAWLTQQKFFIT
jgi:hypothetical protein